MNAIYTEIIALPISERTAQYHKLTTTEKEYCNAVAALESLKQSLAIYDCTLCTKFYEETGRALLVGKIALLDQQVAELEKILA